MTLHKGKVFNRSALLSRDPLLIDLLISVVKTVPAGLTLRATILWTFTVKTKIVYLHRPVSTSTVQQY